MVPEIDIEVLAAWMITRIWAGNPVSEIKIETASADLPFDFQPRAFDTAKARLVTIGLIDANLQITVSGTEAKQLPGQAPAYELRFQMLLGELAQTRSPYEIHDLKRRIANAVTSFSQLVAMIASMDATLRSKQ